MDLYDISVIKDQLNVVSPTGVLLTKKKTLGFAHNNDDFFLLWNFSCNNEFPSSFQASLSLSSFSFRRHNARC